MKQKRSAKIAQNSPTLRNIKPLLGQGHKTYSLAYLHFPIRTRRRCVAVRSLWRYGVSMKKLIVFDLDGTIAESKSSLDDEMSALLRDTFLASSK